MELNQKLFDCMAPVAEDVTVEQVTIGLGYTAVTTSRGDVGICATGAAMEACCAGKLEAIDYERRPAGDLLQQILTDDPMARTMALALINALNCHQVQELPEDADNRVLFDRFKLLSGARVAMVGYFPPLVRLLESAKVPLTVVDDAKGVGDKAIFYDRLDGWADALLITATSIVNNSTETILSHAGPGLKTVLLGPSTPMLAQAFAHLPVHMLAGSALTDREKVLKIVRHGGGAHLLKAASRKVYRLTGLGRSM